jgi:hypothetical protein
MNAVLKTISEEPRAALAAYEATREEIATHRRELAPLAAAADQAHAAVRAILAPRSALEGLKARRTAALASQFLGRAPGEDLDPLDELIRGKSLELEAVEARAEAAQAALVELTARVSAKQHEIATCLQALPRLRWEMLKERLIAEAPAFYASFDAWAAGPFTEFVALAGLTDELKPLDCPALGVAIPRSFAPPTLINLPAVEKLATARDLSAGIAARVQELAAELE